MAYKQYINIQKLSYPNCFEKFERKQFRWAGLFGTYVCEFRRF